MENGLQNGCQVLFKTVTGDYTSTTLQNQSLELVIIVIAINVVSGGFRGDHDLKCHYHENCIFSIEAIL